MFTVSCVKCRNKYESPEPDDYYCPPCNEERLAAARVIDAKARPPKPVMTALQEYDQAPKVRGFLHVRL